MDNDIQNVQEMLDDVLQSIRSVHGDKYAKFVAMMTIVAQVTERVALMRSAALDPEQSERKNEFIHVAHNTTRALLCALSGNLSHEYGIEGDELDSALEWSSKIMDMANERLDEPLQ